jgi:hypothetical protein
MGYLSRSSNIMARVTTQRKAPAQRATRMAKNAPVISTKSVEPMEMLQAKEEPRTLLSTGPAEKAFAEPVLVQAETKRQDQEKLATMKFMNDMLKIHIHSTTNKNDESVFEFIVNGKVFFFHRNETKTVPRYVVDRMARCRPTTFTDHEVINKDGVKDIMYTPHTALRYPFSVIEDPHPRGREWLEATMMEPA